MESDGVLCESNPCVPQSATIVTSDGISHTITWLECTTPFEERLVNEDEDVHAARVAFPGESGRTAYGIGEVVCLYRNPCQRSCTAEGNCSPLFLLFESGADLDEFIDNHQARRYEQLFPAGDPCPNNGNEPGPNDIPVPFGG